MSITEQCLSCFNSSRGPANSFDCAHHWLADVLSFCSIREGFHSISTVAPKLLLALDSFLA